MPLTLVLGPANAAKAGEVLGSYEAAARRDALLVVPTALDAAHYVRELAQHGSVLGAVLTFRGLAEEIAGRCGYVASRLSPLQRDRIVRRAISSLPLEVLSESASSRGFASAAGAFIAELERALITPQRFAAAMRAWGESDPRRAAYAREVASLYLAYARQLERLGRVDGELHAWRALDALRAEPGKWGSTPVFLYGFDDFSPLELDAIETLSRVAGVEVTASLTYEGGRAALSSRAGVAQELRELADRVLELPALDEHYEPGARVALHHLERSLFEQRPARIDPGQAVRLLEAGGERAEAELLAGEVLALLRDGVSASEIVVVCRSLARAAPAIENVFARYGIPLTSGRRRQLTHTAIGKATLAMVKCALLGDAASAQDLLAYLRAPGVLERIELADGLEAQALRQGMGSARELKGLLRWELRDLQALRQSENLLAELSRQARKLLNAPRRQSAPILDERDEVEARALALMVRSLEELRELGERPAAGELIELLESLELPSQHGRDDRVLLAEPLEIRARRFRAVLVCGLCEGEFPLLGTGEPFLSDERRCELAAVSGIRLAALEDGLARERHLLYASVSRATERLVLSFRSSDEEGNLALPSPFIADVCELFVADWPERRARRLLADVVWSAQDAPTHRELLRTRAVAGRQAADEPRRSLGERALRHVRHREVVSANALETFADCPVKWLVERELDPARLEPEADPLARGRYMHQALEEVLRRLQRPVTPESLPSALQALDEVMAEMTPAMGAGRSEPVRAAERQMVEADLKRYLAYEARDGSEWPAQALELRFGFGDEEKSLGPVVLGDDVLLRGVIDRVDVDPSGSGKAVVRDYKAGSAKPEHKGARWAVDRQLQVALYMIAVRELLALEPVAGLYQPLGGEDLCPRGVYLEGDAVGMSLAQNDARDREAFEEVLRDARERAQELAARLRSGVLEPCPQTCSRNGCRYPGLCRGG